MRAMELDRADKVSVSQSEDDRLKQANYLDSI